MACYCALNVEAVPPRFPEPALLTFAALRVTDARSLGPLLALLSTALPLEGLPHVKRVQKPVPGAPCVFARVLMCDVASLGALSGARIEPSTGSCSSFDCSAADGVLGRVREALGGTVSVDFVHIPATLPRERAAIDAACAWPLVCMPRPYAATYSGKAAATTFPSVGNGGCVSKSDAVYFRAGLALALTQAAAGAAAGFKPSGAVILLSRGSGDDGSPLFDMRGAGFSRAELLAQGGIASSARHCCCTGRDCSGSGSLHDAHKQEIGVCPCAILRFGSEHSPVASLESVTPAAASTSTFQSCNPLSLAQTLPFHSAVQAAIETAARADRVVASTFPVGYAIDSAVVAGTALSLSRRDDSPEDRAPSAKRQCRIAGDTDVPAPPPQQYLATGCDVFLSHEPGIGDAMALLHARVSRVAFALPSPPVGALAGNARLLESKSLNHRFCVFRVRGTSTELPEKAA